MSPDKVTNLMVAFEGDLRMLQAKQASFWKRMGCTGADLQADQALAFSTRPCFTSVGVLGHCGRS